MAGKGVEIEGMQELIDKLKKLDKVGNKVCNKALKTAGEEVRKVQENVAKRTHNKYSEKVGYQELKVHGIKNRKSGGKAVDIGLRVKGGTEKTGTGKRSSQWDRAKGLWFNNYGFYHNLTGKYITGSDWMGTAYEESSDKAYKIIKDNLIQGLEEATK